MAIKKNRQQINLEKNWNLFKRESFPSGEDGLFHETCLLVLWKWFLFSSSVSHVGFVTSVWFIALFWFLLQCCDRTPQPAAIQGVRVFMWLMISGFSPTAGNSQRQEHKTGWSHQSLSRAERHNTCLPIPWCLSALVGFLHLEIGSSFRVSSASPTVWRSLRGSWVWWDIPVIPVPGSQKHEEQ